MTQRRAATAEELTRACTLPLLEPLEPKRLGELVGPGAVIAYDHKTALFSAGDPADRFFVILEGSVRLYAATADGRESTIAIMEAPSSFGEAAMFSSGLFPVNGAANRGAVLLHVAAGPFLAELSARAELGLQMLHALRRWELTLLEEIREAKLMSPVQRLAGFVLSLCGDRAGPITVRLPFKKAMLASKLGIQPETLSRNFQRLAAAGISSSGDTVNIADTKVLLRLFRGESAAN